MIKFILPAKDIPDDSIVTKVTGTSKYTLARQLRIYAADGERHTIETEGVVFLLNKDNPSSINTYPDTKEFKVEVEESEAEAFLQNVLASRRFY